MNRIDLQQLAQARIREAEALLLAGEWSGAYYLAGYAVECGLKACIAKLTGLHEFPDKERVLQSYSHKVENLLIVAQLKAQRDAAQQANPALTDNWLTVRDWSEAARYAPATEIMARELVAAIAHQTDGVLTWIMGHW